MTQNGLPAKSCRKLLLQLFRTTHYVPGSLFLKHVRRANGLAFLQGPGGDTYKGSYGSQVVAIKASRFNGEKFVDYVGRGDAGPVGLLLLSCFPHLTVFF